jgi:hypothetical protein
MTLRVAVAARNAGLDAIFDRADAGSGPGTIEVRTGSQPATADTAESGTLLVTFTLADPAFSAASTGTAGWARCKDSAGNTVFDGSVGTSGTDFIINSTSITSGQTVNLTLGSVTDPA